MLLHELQYKLSIMQATYTPEAGLPHQYPPMVAQHARLRGRTHSMHQQAAVACASAVLYAATAVLPRAPHLVRRNSSATV